jgi:hypothetical protein
MKYPIALFAITLTVSFSSNAVADDVDSKSDLSGLYLRVGVGASTQRDRVDIGVNSGTVSGAGQAVELAVGYAVSRNLVLGMAVEYDIGYKTSLEFDSDEITAQNEYLLVTGGPFATWYPAADRTWHITGGAGLGVTTTVSNIGVEGGGATGIGTFVGLGREWKISEGWALGAVLRAQYAHTTDDVNLGGLFGAATAEHDAFGLGLMVAGSYD